MLGNRELTIDDYLAILRRRKWVILVPMLLGPIIGYAVSLPLPSQYTSQTLVLVEQQKVPESYVRSVVTDVLNARLASMQEQILSRTRLQPIIDKFGLYRDQAGQLSMEGLVAKLRSSIQVSPVRAMLGIQPGTQPGGLPGFYITFTAGNPRVAQQVCSEITSMFLEENLRQRQQSAENTTRFIASQLEDAKRDLDEQDARLAAFKRRYLGQLPGQEQMNLSLLMQMNTQLEAVTQTLNRTQQDKVYLESLLSQQLATWEASQSGTSPQTLDQQLRALESQLAALEALDTSEHPDVIKLKTQIAELKKKMAEADAAAKEATATTKAASAASEPPAIFQLRNQIHQYDMTIKEMSQGQERLQEQIKTYQARVQLSPAIEEQYKDITRDYQTALKFYNDLLAKKNESEMATDLERRQQGEQFRVMDPANLPGKPTFPNRPMFAGFGFGSGLGLGLAVAVLLELRDKAIRTDSDVEFYLKLPVLAMVPVLDSTDGHKKRFWKRAKASSSAASLRIGA